MASGFGKAGREASQCVQNSVGSGRFPESRTKKRGRSPRPPPVSRSPNPTRATYGTPILLVLQAPCREELMSAPAPLGYLRRAAFVQIPLDLLIACAERKGIAFVYGWLWHHAGQHDNAFPSIDTLARECRMKADDVRQALRYLVEQGWVQRQERPGTTTLFHVRMEAGPPGPPPAAAAKPSQPTPPQNGGPHPSPKRGGVTRTTEQEPQNKTRTPPNPRYARVRPPWGLRPHRARWRIRSSRPPTASSPRPRPIALLIHLSSASGADQQAKTNSRCSSRSLPNRVVRCCRPGRCCGGSGIALQLKRR